MKNEGNSLRHELAQRVGAYCREKGLLDCDAVITGCSGGPDSVALLLLLSDLIKESGKPVKLYAIHINHNLRPGDCDRDQALTAKFCVSVNVPLKIEHFDVERYAEETRMSVETAGRMLRYEAFDTYADELRENKGYKEIRIAVAHHKNDLAETMMMNLFRGAGLEGLVAPKARTGNIIRPLLCCCKSELEEMLRQENIKYAVDMTNMEPEGTRNVWRNVLFPEVEKRTGVNASGSLNRTYSLMEEDLDYLSAEADKAYEKCLVMLGRNEEHQIRALDCKKAKELAPAMSSRVIRKLWQENFGNLTDFETSNLKLCSDLIARKQVNGEVLLPMPFSRKAYRFGDFFCFTSEKDGSDCARAIASDKGLVAVTGPVSVNIKVPDTYGEDGAIAVKIPNTDRYIYIYLFENKGDLEYNNFSWFCPIESAQDGKLVLLNSLADPKSRVFGKAGASGSKKVTRFFTDLKVPESARDNVLFVARNGEDKILWIPGIGHAEGFTSPLSRERYMQSGGTKAAGILKITLERRQDGN